MASTPLKNMKVSWDLLFPTEWKVIKFMFQNFQTTNQIYIYIYIYMYIHHVHPFSSFWTIQKTSKNIDDESHEIPVPPGIPASVVRLVLGLVHHCSRSPSPSRSPAETPMAMAGRDSWTISTAMADQKWVSYQPVILYRSIYIYAYIVDLPFSTTSCDFKATMCC